MNGYTQVLSHLNQALSNELIAINQYFLHARMYKNWGFGKLNDKEYHESIHAMKSADVLIERILFLEGLPNLQDLGKLLVGENVEEMLKTDKMLVDEELIPVLKAGIAYCETAQDYVSRKILNSILHEKEEHLDWLETQQNVISEVGLQNYQQAMM